MSSFKFNGTLLGMSQCNGISCALKERIDSKIGILLVADKKATRNQNNEYKTCRGKQ